MPAEHLADALDAADDAFGELALAKRRLHRGGHFGPERRAALLVDRGVAEDPELPRARSKCGTAGSGLSTKASSQV